MKITSAPKYTATVPPAPDLASEVADLKHEIRQLKDTFQSQQKDDLEAAWDLKKARDAQSERNSFIALGVISAGCAAGSIFGGPMLSGVSMAGLGIIGLSGILTYILANPRHTSIVGN